MNVDKHHWIERNVLIELLKQVPIDAQLAVNNRGNLVWHNDKMSGFIDIEDELVETLPDREL